MPQYLSIHDLKKIAYQAGLKIDSQDVSPVVKQTLYDIEFANVFMAVADTAENRQVIFENFSDWVSTDSFDREEFTHARVETVLNRLYNLMPLQPTGHQFGFCAAYCQLLAGSPAVPANDSVLAESKLTSNLPASGSLYDAAKRAVATKRQPVLEQYPSYKGV